MKKQNPIVYLFTIACISAMMVFSACNDDNANDNKEDSKEVAKEQNDMNIEGRKNEKDADFMVDASVISREEVSLGQLAQQKGKSAEIKKLGKMMEDDHTKALADSKALASKKGITIPEAQTDKEKEAYTKLNEKSGVDFDKAYASMMVDGYKEAISKFEDAAEHAADVDIKNWASTMLPILKTHLEHAEDCKRHCDEMK